MFGQGFATLCQTTAICLYLGNVVMSVQKNLPQNPDWMTNLPHARTTLPLSAIAMPGTHDAYAYNLTKEIADIDELLQQIIEMFPGDFGLNVAWRYSVTQKMTAAEQLVAGVRYFDIRTAGKDNVTDEWFVYHGFYGEKIRTIMIETRQFLDEQRKEIVLLDFCCFFKIDDAEHKNIISFLLETFSDVMLPRPINHLNESTLGNIWLQQKQVIVFYPEEHTQGNKLFWPRNYITGGWANTIEVPELIEYVEKRYENDRTDNEFATTGANLTPNAVLIVTNPLRSLETSLAYKANLAFSSWLKSKRAGLSGINVASFDFIEFGDGIDTVINLNYQ